MFDVQTASNRKYSQCRREPVTEAQYRKVMLEYNFELANTVLKHCANLANTEAEIENLTLLFFEYCIENEDNPNHINSLGNTLNEALVKKVRTGTQTKDYIKNRVARFKTKLHTKFNTNINRMKDKNSNAIQQFKTAIDGVSKATAGMSPSSLKKAATKEEAIYEVFCNLEESIEKKIMTESLLGNQRYIEKHFKEFNEIAKDRKLDNQSKIYQMCGICENIDLTDKVRYNLALQNIDYTLYKNRQTYNKSEILEHVTDYFLMTRKNPPIDDMVSVLEHNRSKFYSDTDLEELNYMFKDIEKLGLKFNDPIVLIHEVDSKAIKNFATASTNKIKPLIKEFKKTSDKNVAKVRALLTKIYTQPKEDIVKEFPDILGMFRQCAIFFPLASLNPLLGLAGLFADYAIKLHLSRPQLDKYIDAEFKEIEKVNDKIKNAKSDEEKKRLEEYKKSLEKSYDKLKHYRNELYTEKEVEELSDKDMDRENKFDDEELDFDFGFDDDDDLDLDLDEAASIVNFDKLIYNIGECSKYVDNSALEGIIEYFQNYTDEATWNRFKVSVLMLVESEAYNNHSDESYSRLDIVRKQMYQPFNSREYRSMNECLTHLKSTIEGYTLIERFINDKLNSDAEALNEGDIMATLKLAGINLKKGIRNLSDKEKGISRSIDANVNTFTRGIERALRNDNREAVIRGSIIPSASKTIKWGITLGAAWCIEPVIAVITGLGALAMGKKLQAKERQLILDEIEIELDMTERYIRIAEDKNDMKAVRELLKIKRNLQRQQQRIKYKMRVYYNQTTNVSKSSSMDDDD